MERLNTSCTMHSFITKWNFTFMLFRIMWIYTDIIDYFLLNLMKIFATESSSDASIKVSPCKNASCLITISNGP